MTYETKNNTVLIYFIDKRLYEYKECYSKRFELVYEIILYLYVL